MPDDTTGEPKLRVLLLLFRFALGGAELLALETFESLKDRIELHTVVMENGLLADRFAALGPVTLFTDIPFHASPDGPDGGLQPDKAALFTILSMDWWPDLIYVNAIASLRIADALELPDIPILVHLHNIGVSLRFRVEPNKTWFLNRPKRYIAVSEVLRQELIDQYGIPADKIGIVHGFIPDDFPALPSSLATEVRTQPLIIGGSGNLSWLKGPDLWLMTAVELKALIGESSFRFAWVGVDDNLAGKIFRYQAEKLNLGSLVDFIPLTTEPLTHYAAFDVFAQTSWEDTFPLVVLENMALKKPVLCFEGSGGAPEAVGDCGIVVPGFSPRAMAEAIAGLARSPERRAALGKAARERVLTHFTAATQVPKIWEEIRLCAAPARTASATGDTTAIVLAVYNGEKYLDSAIRSVLRQTSPAWQLVIIDDGSVDESGRIAWEFAKKDPRIKVVAQENAGLSEARNRGIAEADPSDYIAFLDADDIWEPHWLEVLTEAVCANPNALGAHGLARFINSAGVIFREGQMEAFERGRKAIVGDRLVDWPLDAPTTFAVQAYRNFMPVCGTLIRRAEIEATGPFVPGLRSCEDWEMWLRMTQRGDFHFVDRVVYNYRLHEGNKTSDENFETQLRREVRRLVIHSKETSPEHRRIAKLGYRFEEREHCKRHLAAAERFWSAKQPVPAVKHWRQAVLSYVRSRIGNP